MSADQSLSVLVMPLGNPVAQINAIRAHDNEKAVWYNVYPENQQAYCTPGPAGPNSGLHVIFGAKNIGTADGNLFGKMTDDTGAVLIASSSQWCVVGNFVYWEKDIVMPTRNYTVTCQVGHVALTGEFIVDQTYKLGARVEGAVLPVSPYVIVGAVAAVSVGAYLLYRLLKKK